MSKIEINKEFKKYLDQLCENHIIKITKKNETEKAFNYIKEDLINKIIENLEEEQKITKFETKYTYCEKNSKKYNYSNPIFENINEEYFQDLCQEKGINLEKKICSNNKESFVTIIASLIYNYTPSKELPKVKKRKYYEI